MQSAGYNIGFWDVVLFILALCALAGAFFIIKSVWGFIVKTAKRPEEERHAITAQFLATIFLAVLMLLLRPYFDVLMARVVAWPDLTKPPPVSPFIILCIAFLRTMNELYIPSLLELTIINQGVESPRLVKFWDGIYSGFRDLCFVFIATIFEGKGIFSRIKYIVLPVFALFLISAGVNSALTTWGSAVHAERKAIYGQDLESSGIYDRLIIIWINTGADEKLLMYRRLWGD